MATKSGLHNYGEVEKSEYLYKVLVIGDLGSGKTSLIRRYVHQFFSEHYRATIGVDFALKVINWDPDTIIRLQLWDIAGQVITILTGNYNQRLNPAFFVILYRQKFFDCPML